jgi:transcriptional regulator with XRE-family HTH domain
MNSVPKRPDFNVEVGHRLKQMRLERGMTQEDLGRKLGVSFQQVQKYERGLNALNIEKLLIVAAVLHVEPQAFWQGADFNHGSQSPLSPDRATLGLVRAFRRISDPRRRQALLDLVRQIAETDQPHQ